MDPLPLGSAVSTPTYEPANALLVGGAATYIFTSRTVTVVEPETKIPLFLPEPFDFTLMVEPLTALNENEFTVKPPVPLNKTPATMVPEPSLCTAAELSTVVTVVLTFAVAAVVVGNNNAQLM